MPQGLLLDGSLFSCNMRVEKKWQGGSDDLVTSFTLRLVVLALVLLDSAWGSNVFVTNVASHLYLIMQHLSDD